jgi:hypothetical protein
MRVEVSVPTPGRYRLFTGWIASSRPIEATFAVGPVTARIVGAASSGSCGSLAGPVVELRKTLEFMDISVDSPQTLDYVELSADR